MLLLGVGVLVAIDIIILTTYTIVEHFHNNLSAELAPSKEHPEDLVGVSIKIMRLTLGPYQ
jgi:hypothetical protein